MARLPDVTEIRWSHGVLPAEAAQPVDRAIPDDDGEPLETRVLRQLAGDEASLAARLVEAEQSARAYQMLAQEALSHCQALTVALSRSAATVERLHGIIRTHIGSAPGARAA